MLFFVRAGIVTKLWFLLLPLVYIVFSAVWGLFLNIKFPKFSWESETEVVKQSASVGISILGIFAVIIPGAVHTDLYDGGGKNAIPFDKIESFLRKHLQADASARP